MLCKCGCGIETSLARRTDTRYGTTKGQPLPYALGHHNFLKRLPDEEARQRKRISRKTWASRNPECKRKTRLKAMGWTEDSIANAKHEQGNRCAICNRIEDVLSYESELVPDHKHCNPPVPRGVLCRSCNRSLGFFKDSPELLEAAASYLRKFSGTT